jgi:predicted phage gp36 major capsid-like protein
VLLASLGLPRTRPWVTRRCSGLAAASAMGTVELKKLEDELKTTFEKFKETHSALETEQKKQGEATAETNEQLKKLNARLDEVEIKASARAHDGRHRSHRRRDSRRARARCARSERKAFAKWARRGHTRLTDDEVKSSLAQVSRSEEGEYKALETDSDVEGGVFVPHQLANRVIQKLILVSPFRSVASVENDLDGALEIPAEGTQNFDAGWVGERASRPKTNDGVARHGADSGARDVRRAARLADAARRLRVRRRDLALEPRRHGMAQLEGIGFIKGNGVTQPEGIANNSQIPAASS